MHIKSDFPIKTILLDDYTRIQGDWFDHNSITQTPAPQGVHTDTVYQIKHPLYISLEKC